MSIQFSPDIFFKAFCKSASNKLKSIESMFGDIDSVSGVIPRNIQTEFFYVPGYKEAFGFDAAQINVNFILSNTELQTNISLYLHSRVKEIRYTSNNRCVLILTRPETAGELTLSECDIVNPNNTKDICIEFVGIIKTTNLSPDSLQEYTNTLNDVVKIIIDYISSKCV